MMRAILARLWPRQPEYQAPAQADIDAARADLAARRASHRPSSRARAHLRGLINTKLRSEVAAREGGQR